MKAKREKLRTSQILSEAPTSSDLHQESRRIEHGAHCLFRSLRVKSEPFDETLPTIFARNGPSVFPFGDSPHAPPDDLGKLTQTHLERNPARSDSLNERLGLAVRVKGGHVVVATL